MAEDALKSRFLEGVALMNLERFEPAVTLFREICDEAERLGNKRLLAIGCNNLVQVHGYLGDSDQALALAQETLKLFQKLDNRVGLAKLQWGVGTLLKTKGNLPAAVEAFQAAQDGFSTLQMRSDVAALHLVLADVHLELGNQSEATRQVLMAVPIIQAENMVPEGMAAFALLQESVRHQKLDRKALRDLHGYFEEVSAS
ncbi:MAG: tetratricopeptide repeat protein [Acidobacteriota bacterium]